jgi:hypothetical protein
MTIFVLTRKWLAHVHRNFRGLQFAAIIAAIRSAFDIPLPLGQGDEET